MLNSSSRICFFSSAFAFDDSSTLSDRNILLCPSSGLPRHTISNVKQKTNFKLEIAGIFITMADMMTNYSWEILELLRNAYSGGVVSKIQATSFDELFQTGGGAESDAKQVQEIPLAELFPFKGHRFHGRDNSAMRNHNLRWLLAYSITTARTYGCTSARLSRHVSVSRAPCSSCL